MQSFLEELKIKSCFQIGGIIALDGVPKRRKFPNMKAKLKITEHHFLWILNNPNLSCFSILFYFYPIQVTFLLKILPNDFLRITEVFPKIC